jgi:hypothetical protein
MLWYIYYEYNSVYITTCYSIYMAHWTIAAMAIWTNFKQGLRTHVVSMCQSLWFGELCSGVDTLWKRCVYMYCYISNSTDELPCSSWNQWLSIVQKSTLYISRKLVFANGQISLYLLTRVHVIIIHLIVVVHGLFEGRELYGRPFLWGVMVCVPIGGIFYITPKYSTTVIQFFLPCHLMVSSVSV